MENNIAMNGFLGAQVTRAAGPDTRWRLRNVLRVSYIVGLLVNLLARLFTRLTGIPTIVSQLEGRLIRANGKVVNFGVLSRRVVTTAGVGFLVDDWDNSATDITNMNFHACGTGTNAENVSDVGLQTETSSITSRQTGTKSQPSANQLQTQAAQSFTGAGAITEHGLLSASSNGVLWDRSVFAAINVANGDSIQWTYTCTVNAGG